MAFQALKMKSIAGFPGGRHVRQAREPLRRRDRVDLDGTRLDLRDDVERLVDHVVDLAGDEVAGAPVRCRDRAPGWA